MRVVTPPLTDGDARASRLPLGELHPGPHTLERLAL